MPLQRDNRRKLTLAPDAIVTQKSARLIANLSDEARQRQHVHEFAPSSLDMTAQHPLEQGFHPCPIRLGVVSDVDSRHAGIVVPVVGEG